MKNATTEKVLLIGLHVYKAHEGIASNETFTMLETLPTSLTPFTTSINLATMTTVLDTFPTGLGKFITFINLTVRAATVLGTFPTTFSRFITPINLAKITANVLQTFPPFSVLYLSHPST